MRSPSQLKREFLRKWAKGLQLYRRSNKDMSFQERKKAIKLSADVAMASASGDTTCWGRALIADASNDDTTKVVVEHMLGHENNDVSWLKKGSAMWNNKKVRSKKILRKSCILGRARTMEGRKANLATCIAKRMVKKRTQMLKSLVPGGESMDEVSLIQEALDYIISLQVQVNVMRGLAKITELAC